MGDNTDEDMLIAKSSLQINDSDNTNININN